MENIYITSKVEDYELLDSGEGKKLERFGDFVVSRPDPQAIWTKSLPESVWKEASAVFEQNGGKGRWSNKKPFPEDWKINLSSNTFLLKKSIFKHLGIFPEQMSHWVWLEKIIKEKVEKGEKVSVLNLFGYTGGATLACARAGASVCHVDSSDFAIDLAMKNRDASNLKDKTIRFIVDDVRKFVEKEIRRGSKYDIVVMDPPVYGKGVKNEIWNLEKDLNPFLLRIEKVLSDKPVAILLNGYASGYSHITYKQVLEKITNKIGGNITSGELAIEESKNKRLLPAGIFVRWEK